MKLALVRLLGLAAIAWTSSEPCLAQEELETAPTNVRSYGFHMTEWRRWPHAPESDRSAAARGERAVEELPAPEGVQGRFIPTETMIESAPPMQVGKLPELPAFVAPRTLDPVPARPIGPVERVESKLHPLPAQPARQSQASRTPQEEPEYSLGSLVLPASGELAGQPDVVFDPPTASTSRPASSIAVANLPSVPKAPREFQPEPGVSALPPAAPIVERYTNEYVTSPEPVPQRSTASLRLPGGGRARMNPLRNR